VVDTPGPVTWIGDSDYFWYPKTVKGGTEFVLGEADEGKKGPAFDQEKLAAAISQATGHTYTALNLALSMASEGIHDVLLIDADTVRRSLTQALDLGDAPGLIELLGRPGRSFMDYALRTSVERLRVLPAGVPCDGASDLFSFGRVGPVVAAINSALGGHIAIVDTAPILLSSDTPVLMDSAGQVLLVVRAGHTLQDSVKDAVSRIKESVPVGVVLNDWDPLLASERQAYYGYEAYAK